MRSLGGIRGCSRAAGADVNVLEEGRRCKEDNGMPSTEPEEAGVPVDDGRNCPRLNVVGGELRVVEAKIIPVPTQAYRDQGRSG